MKFENHLKILLELNSDWEVNSIDFDHTGQCVLVRVTYISNSYTDLKTGELLTIYDHRGDREWRHLDTLQYKTLIVSNLPRVQDSQGKVSTIEVPWAEKSQRHTYLLERRIIDTLEATKNQTKTAKLLNVGFYLVNRIIHLSVRRGLLVRAPEEVKSLSIDEKSFKKGHQYITVLSNPETGKILDVGDGRTKEAAKTLINEVLTDHQKQQVETVSMDMWKAYINVVKEQLPNSKICHDKFHLVKYLNEAVDKVRRREATTQEELRNTRYIWLKDHMNLTEKQRIKFDAIDWTNYKTSKAWRIKENFRAIHFKQSQNEAFILFYRWLQNALKCGMGQIIKVAKMFKTHMVGIINAMVYAKSNAMAERLNGKIQEIKLSARGYRKFDNFRSAILFFHGGLNLYPQ